MIAAHSHEHETCVIGCVILEPSIFDEVTSVITEQDFFDPSLRDLFKLICDLHVLGKPINDMALLKSEAKKRKLEVGPADIAEAFLSVTHIQHAPYYAEQVAEQSKLRKLKLLISEVSSRLSDVGADSGEILNLIEARTKSIDTSSSIEIDDAVDAIRKFEAVPESEIMAMTGLHRFDRDFGGFAGGELIVVGSRLGGGKTAFGWQIMLESLKAGFPCLFVSLEMKTPQLMQRHFASAAGVPPIAIRKNDLTSEQRERIELHKEIFQQFPVSIYAPPRATVRQIAAAARLKMSGGGLKLLVVDYIQRIQPSMLKKDKREQMIEISGELKSLALDLNVPVIALTQLNRVADGVIPKTSHIAECDRIGQDADQVLLLHRLPDRTDLRVAKHRYIADDAAIELQFQNGRFTDMAGTSWEP